MLTLQMRFVPGSGRVRAAALGLILPVAGCVPALGQAHSQALEWELDFQRGTQEFQAAQFAEAEKDFREVVRLRPTFAPGYLNLGLTMASEQNPKESVQLLERAIALNPNLRGAQLFAGIGEYNLGRFAQAGEHLKKAAVISPKDPQAWMWLGVVELALGHSREAAAALDKAADLDPKNVDIMYHRGRAHMDLSKDIYEQMFKSDRESWRVHQVLAQSFDEQGNYTQAVLEYNRAIQVVPRESGLHEALGDAQWQLNSLDDARAAYEQEVAIDPQSASAVYKLGVILVEQSRPDQAIPLLQRALALDSGMYHANFWLGRAEQALDQDADAVKDFQIAATYPGADAPTMETAWYHLAQVYRKLHLKEEEQAAMQKFRELRAKSDADKFQGIDAEKKALLGHDPGTP
jgi:tetratricopeptide (TPR) repeat protein